MECFRLAKTKHRALDGFGASLLGARWNPIDWRMVYASEHRSLALLEVLVHVKDGTFRDPFSLHHIQIPDELVETADVDARLLDVAAMEERQAFGLAWLQSNRSLALRVPSAVVPQEFNVLLNPYHPEMTRVTLQSTPYLVDQRLIR